MAHIKPVSLDRLVEQFQVPAFIPQAILGKSPEAIESAAHIHFTEEEDELDTFDSASFIMDVDGKREPVSLRRYRDSSPGTTTIYFSSVHMGDLEAISRLVRETVKALRLPSAAITWQRRDDPEL